MLEARRCSLGVRISPSSSGARRPGFALTASAARSRPRGSTAARSVSVTGSASW